MNSTHNDSSISDEDEGEEEEIQEVNAADIKQPTNTAVSTDSDNNNNNDSSNQENTGSAEAYLIQMFENGHLCTTHAKRVTLMREDLELALNISGDSINK
nr:13281_t:CDS:2 [Entrophospora candida]